jgi:glutamine transport system substrate-binding protein
LIIVDHPIRRPEEILVFRSLQQSLASKLAFLWTVGPKPEGVPMLTLIARLILSAMLASVFTYAARAQGKAQELRVVTRMAPPFVVTTQGQLSGFSIDLWNGIARRMTTRTKYHVAPDVVALLDDVRSGKADAGIAAVSITAEREKEFEFSEPILHAGLQIMVRSGSDGIKGPEDLPGKRIGTAPGSTAAAFLRTIDAQIHEFGTIKYAAFALLDNNVDAIVYDAPVLRHYAAHAGRGHVQVIGPLLQKEDYGIVFPQNSTLRKHVNDTLRLLREDGSYRKLHDKWFTN